MEDIWILSIGFIVFIIFIIIQNIIRVKLKWD